MTQPTDDKHWLTRPATLRRLRQAAGAALLLSVAVQLFAGVKGYFVVDGWLGFGALFGFAACAAMVFVAKALGVVLKRDENYYPHGADDA